MAEAPRNPKHFTDLLIDRIIEKDSRIVIGIDPRWEWIPASIQSAATGKYGDSLPAAQHALVQFARHIIDAVTPHAVAVKPQIAHFEKFGVPGLKAYQNMARYAHQKGLLVIGDIKRNDIGATCEAYADAHLGTVAIGGKHLHPFQVDAVTINAYLGIDGVRPFLDRASSGNQGVFILVKTSNPSSSQFQNLKTRNGYVYQQVAKAVHRWGKDCIGRAGYSLLGAVVGATYPKEIRLLRNIMPRSFFLIPGYGAQGGGADELKHAFTDDGLGAIVNASRSVIYAYRHHRTRHWTHWIEKAARAMKEDINRIVP